MKIYISFKIDKTINLSYYRDVEPPDPIPNSKVKRIIANGTYLLRLGE